MTARLLSLAGVAAFAGFALLLLAGAEYYGLPGVQRPLHPMHADLRSSGSHGLVYGVAALGLFLLNLSYLLRKRFAGVKWLGNLRTWMSFHVFTGLVGAACAFMHSALLPKSALGTMSVVTLGLVVVTGLLGRYIYAHVPRSLRGRELESEELRKRLEEHRAHLQELGVGADLLAIRTEPAVGRDSLVGRLAGLFAGDGEIRREYGRLRRALKGHPALWKVLPVARRFCRDQQFLARYGELRGLMSSWRFLHRWLAIVMVSVLVFHVALALRFGDLL